MPPIKPTLSTYRGFSTTTTLLAGKLNTSLRSVPRPSRSNFNPSIELWLHTTGYSIRGKLCVSWIPSDACLLGIALFITSSHTGFVAYTPRRGEVGIRLCLLHGCRPHIALARHSIRSPSKDMHPATMTFLPRVHSLSRSRCPHLVHGG